MTGDARPEWLDMLTSGLIARWEAMRQCAARPVADRKLRAWLFDTLPAQAGASPDEHAFAVFEAAIELDRRGRTEDAFLLLRWVGGHYGRYPDPDVAVRALRTMIEDCMYLARDKDTYAYAVGVLRGVVDSIPATADVTVERELCAALAHIGYIRSRWRPASRSAQMKALFRLWSEIIRRWGHSQDPVLRGRVAQALASRGVLWLQRGRERDARREFAAILDRFGRDRPGADIDVDTWVSVARHAPAILDKLKLVIGDPEFNLDYLRAERAEYRRLNRRFLGLLRILRFFPGALRPAMPQVVRLARERHLSSVGKVQAWLFSGEPFTLILRNFGITERSAPSSRWNIMMDNRDGTGDHMRVIGASKTGPVLKELARWVPLVQVASTTAGYLEVDDNWDQVYAAAQLYLPNATWFETVKMLIKTATCIIVLCAEHTDALGRELEFLAAAGRAEDTVILLEEPMDAILTMYFHPEPRYERLTRGHVALAGFPYVVDADKLQDRRLKECPELTTLVQRIDAAREVPLNDRLALIRECLGIHS